mmetsp:Transcript_37581/g.105606  ORF Transcript_37581/g.105606 Transcript_37581/m.105606 type:complete len:253 (-) Transcript_37581:46-804(-)
MGGGFRIHESCLSHCHRRTTSWVHLQPHEMYPKRPAEIRVHEQGSVCDGRRFLLPMRRLGNERDGVYGSGLLHPPRRTPGLRVVADGAVHVEGSSPRPHLLFWHRCQFLPAVRDQLEHMIRIGLSDLCSLTIHGLLPICLFFPIPSDKGSCYSLGASYSPSFFFFSSPSRAPLARRPTCWSQPPGGPEQRVLASAATWAAGCCSSASQKQICLVPPQCRTAIRRAIASRPTPSIDSRRLGGWLVARAKRSPM